MIRAGLYISGLITVNAIKEQKISEKLFSISALEVNVEDLKKSCRGFRDIVMPKCLI